MVTFRLRNLIRVGVLLSLTSGLSPAQEDSPTRRIGIVFDGMPAHEEPAFGRIGARQALEAIEKESRVLIGDDFDLRFPEDKRLYCDWDLAKVGAALDRLLADPDVDVILALGVLGTDAAAHREELSKPVIAPFGLDIEAQQFPMDGDASGVRNLNYLMVPHSGIRDIRRFHELVGFEKVHVLYDALFASSIVDFVRGRLEEGGLTMVAVPAGDSAVATLAALPSDAEAVYVAPLLRLSATEFGQLVDGLNQRRIPTFSSLGRQAVEAGILMSQAPETAFQRVARRIGIHLQRILEGEDAGTLPVLLEQPERLVVNMATARAIGFSPRWRVLTEAELLNDQPVDEGRRLSLAAAVREAVDANLELKATDRGVAAGAEEVRRARALYKPQLGLESQAVQIDKDRAALFGPDRTWDGSLTLSQILYSDALRGNIMSQRHLQQARESDRERVRLDVAVDAATAFLDILRTQAIARIQRDNLYLTVSNLELARRRNLIGVARSSEVYRWESRLAADRREVVASEQRVHAARTRLNRILHRPQEEPFSAVDPDLEDPEILEKTSIEPYVENPAEFAVFRDFMVQEGLANSPELVALEAAIAAQERARLTAKRSFWSPDIAAFGEVTEEIDSSSAGGGAALPFTLPMANDTDWAVGINLTLPLYTGGERAAVVRQTSEALAQLRLDREVVAELVELNIRTVLFDVATSGPAIRFNQEGAEAARKNLELVTRQYARGIVPIIDLLDAQNASLQADQLAANSVYDFLIDVMFLQRAAANFNFFTSEAERDEFFQRLDAYSAGARR